MLGEKLINAARTAKTEVTLIAPFMKADVLSRVLSDVAETVKVCVIARWTPAEIAVGVCDLEIFDVVCSRKNAALYVHPLLHAKLYRFDDLVFFGSANLTNKALGWRAPSNIELLHLGCEIRSELDVFECDLLRSAIRVDSTYRDFVMKEVEKIQTIPIAASNFFTAETHQLQNNWLPTCRTPERLWSVYSENEATKRRMVESAFEAAQNDLVALDIPSGLPSTQFKQYAAAILARMPLVQAIDIASQKGITEKEATEMIIGATSVSELPYSPSEMWEVLKAWLIYFFPTRYRLEAVTEVFRQGRIIV